MTLVQFKNRPLFNNFIDDFFSAKPSLFHDDLNKAQLQSVPVNIKETEQEYLLEVVAPGWNKEAFEINLEQNMLTISAERKKEIENSTEKHICKEYQFQSFKRSFTMEENVDTEKISAKYVNGILSLNLPKKADVKEPVKQISIE